jgi:hypothetical protein
LGEEFSPSVCLQFEAFDKTLYKVLKKKFNKNNHNLDEVVCFGPETGIVHRQRSQGY